MQTDDFGSLGLVVEVAIGRLAHIAAQFFERVAFSKNRVTQSARGVAAVRLVFADFKDDFALSHAHKIGFERQSRQRSLQLRLREENHVADAFLAEESRRGGTEEVDAEADAARRGQAVFEGDEESRKRRKEISQLRSGW